jgi:glycosyl transferase family 25
MIRTAYIISAKSDQQKRMVLQKRFHDVGLDVQFVDAVMGNTLSAAQKQDFLNSDRQNWLPTVMQDNALGCALSHHKIWEQIAYGDQDYGLICEDDAMPLPATSPHITAVLDQLAGLDKPIDILFLGNRRPQRKATPVCALEYVSADYDFRLTAIKYNSIGAECYLLSRHAARALLKNNYRYIFEVDCMLHHWWLHSCHVLHLDPPLFAEEGRPSTIGYTHIKSWPRDRIHHKLKRKWRRIRTSYIKRIHFPRVLKRLRAYFG